METPFATPVLVHLDAAGHIDQDMTCIRCGYNLRGLSPDGVCPECGTAIGRSLHGDLLRFAPPDWVENLAAGMNWIVAAIIIGIAAGALSVVLSSAVGARGLGELIAHALGIVSVIGYWKVTTPDPGRLEQEPPVNARNLVRLTVVLNYVFGFARLGAGAIDRRVLIVALAIAGLSGVVNYFAIFTYARQLALRIPNLRLAGQTRIVMWGMVAVAVFAMLLLVSAMSTPASGARPPRGGDTLVLLACSAGLGTLIFGIWSLVLLLWFRRELATAARQARQTWARPAFPASPPQW
jgi:hypothetical protein